MRINEPAQASLQSAVFGQPAAIPHKNRFAGQNRMAGSQPVWQPKAPLAADFAPQSDQVTNLNAPVEGLKPSGVPKDKQLGFADMLDVINPLQHIPVVATIYRKLTGDKISAPAQFMGGMLYGGPIGAAGAMVSVAMQEKTGMDFGQNVAALVDGSDTAFKTKTPDIKLADNKTGTVDFDSLQPAGGKATYDFGYMPRTAGLMPVWTGQPAAVAEARTASKSIPAIQAGDSIAPDAHFALMLQKLEANTHHIS